MELVEATVTSEDLDAFLDRLRTVGDEHGVTVQAFDARYVVGREHLARAVTLADRARERDEAVARDRAVEILLYAAGRRQIDRALTVGVGEGECPAVVLVDSPDDNSDAERAAAAAIRDLPVVDPAETPGEYDPERVREFFDVGDAELAATDADLAALVGERVALLTVEK